MLSGCSVPGRCGQLSGVSAPRQAYFNHSGHNRARNPQSRDDPTLQDAARGLVDETVPGRVLRDFDVVFQLHFFQQPGSINAHRLRADGHRLADFD